MIIRKARDMKTIRKPGSVKENQRKNKKNNTKSKENHRQSKETIGKARKTQGKQRKQHGKAKKTTGKARTTIRKPQEKHKIIIRKTRDMKTIRKPGSVKENHRKKRVLWEKHPWYPLGTIPGTPRVPNQPYLGGVPVGDRWTVPGGAQGPRGSLFCYFVLWFSLVFLT